MHGFHLQIVVSPLQFLAFVGAAFYFNRKLDLLLERKHAQQTVQVPVSDTLCELCGLRVARSRMVEGKITCANCEAGGK